ncbi:hypothetical protein JCGZ_26742 [Jatropha curcas]|uniref:Uncharacterized protein n=1 Tax=Jatropha curcas TaxID=180498 RepID=A0A067LCE3_JATCU|nr:hypothetical protein JCGZ_26742 [Jatropha curcas]
MGLVAGGRLAVWREAARAGWRAVDLLSLASHTEIDAGKKKRKEKKRKEKKRKEKKRKEKKRKKERKKKRKKGGGGGGAVVGWRWRRNGG